MQPKVGYATKSDSDVYHLVDLNTLLTLCGLATHRTANSTIVLLVDNQCPEGKLCRHCDDAADEKHEIAAQG